MIAKERSKTCTLYGDESVLRFGIEGHSTKPPGYCQGLQSIAARRRAVRNLKLDESCISNPKSEIVDWTPELGFPCNFRPRISDLRCRIRPISKFLSLIHPAGEEASIHRKRDAGNEGGGI